MNLRVIIAIAAVMCIPASVLWAQKSTDSSSIVLRVRDQSGAAVGHARVQIQSSASNINEDFVTAADGKLSADISPGDYDLTVDSPGFLKFTKHIKAEPDQAQRVDVVLKIEVCEPCPLVSTILPITLPEASQAVSPDGRYAVVEAPDGSGAYHTVFIEDRRLKSSRRKLFSYDQRIIVLWNYDSRLFAVTKYTSGGSDCTIFSADGSSPPISALAVLSRQLSRYTWEQLESRLSNHHVYVQAVVWMKPKTLQVRISVDRDEGSGHSTEFYDVLYPSKRHKSR